MMPDVKVEFTVPELVAYTYFAGTRTGKKYLFESGKIATSYAAKQLALTARTFGTDPASRAVRSPVTKAVVGSVVRAAPALSTLVVGGAIFNAIGNTHAVQTAGHIMPAGVMGMGGTF